NQGIGPAAALLALLAASCSQPKPPAAAGIVVERAWIRLPAVAGGAAAGYFTISSGRADRLVGVAAPGARIEMHESMASGGMMVMKPLAAVTLPAGERIAFAPGGRHLMIFGLGDRARPGGRLALTFRFAASAPVTVPATLAGAGDEAPGREG